jgi:tetratricopeptide (TPR) repeat protein
LNRGEIERARDYLEEVRANLPQKLFLELVPFMWDDRHNKNMEKQLEKYLADPQNYLMSLIIGDFYKEQNEQEKARIFFKRAIDQNNDIVIPYYRMAELESKLGNRKAAIALLWEAIGRRPEFIKSYKALGSVYEELKDYKNARLVYEEGLRYGPDDSELLNNLAWINLMYLGDYSAAYIHIRRAMGLSPEDPDIQDTLAWWYHLNNDSAQALSLLKKIVNAQPSGPLYRYHLGLVYLNVGERQEGLINLQKALDLGITDEYRTEIRELLK